VLLGNTKRTVSVRAKSFSVMYVLVKKDLDPILVNYPEIQVKFKNLASIRLKELINHNAKIIV
jgi:CRP-like cAMP-binding protein